MWKLLKLCLCIGVIIFNVLYAGCEETSASVKEKLVDKSQGDKHVLKRYDQEYQTCLESFDIHKDKIIRTQDSREMGAKYINEFDLGSRDECLRACCGTETCDVFVFEEKSPGSCYLFHCGPPDDFKCKFTKHHNYTSAVLASTRHLNELENQIKLTKHEQELTQLRKPDAVAQSTGTPYASTTIVVPEPPKETVQVATITTNNSAPGRRCSVYQFECRSSGECIAIYNACDGIPQCADGSDEAPELDCPPLGTTQPPSSSPIPRSSPSPLLIPKVPPIPEPPVQRKYSTIQEQQQQQQLQQQQQQQQQLQQQQQQPQQQQHANLPNIAQEGQPMAAGYNNGGQMFRQQPPPQAWQQPLQQVPLPQQSPAMPQYPVQHNEMNKALNPMTPNVQLPGKLYSMEGENQNTYNMPWNNYQHMTAGQYPGTGNHQFEDGNSHIFNHKGNSLVLDSDRYSSGSNSLTGTRVNGQYNENHNDYNTKYPSNTAGNNMYYNNGPYRPPVSPNMWQLNQQSQTHDMNSMPSLGEIPHPENERKMALPADYYYEDGQGMAAQETRFRGGVGLHDHDHEPGMHHQDIRPYPYHPPQKNSADPGPSSDKMEQKPKLESGTSLETKFQQDISPIPYKNKGSIDVHVKQEKMRHHSNELTTPENKTKAKGNGSVKKQVQAQDPIKERLMEENVMIKELDEQVGRPTGAILSLALGICITGLLITMVGCRVRVIRKRLRRGSKTYAHDADYLVNGMYL